MSDSSSDDFEYDRSLCDPALRAAVDAAVASARRTDSPASTRRTDSPASTRRTDSPASSEGDAAAVLAALTCDWAYVLLLGNDGWMRLEWLGGHRDLPESTADPNAIAAPWDRYVAEADRERMRDHLLRAIRNGTDRAEIRFELPGIGLRFTESAIRCIPDRALEGAVRLHGALIDITDRRRIEEALDKSESQYRALVEQASDGILVFDTEGRILTCNEAAIALVGVDRETLHATPVGELFAPEEPDADPRMLEGLGRGETMRSVRRLRRPDSTEPVWTELSARRLVDGRIQAMVRDITSRKETEQRIRRLAYYDSLTALPNRESFHELVEEAVQASSGRDQSLALLFLDVDRFKQVNDSLGHAYGDELLVQVADRLRSAVRGSDRVARREGMATERSTSPGSHRGTSISRLGGDEFTILLQDLDHAQDAARVARRVLHLMSRPFKIRGRELFVGASVGIAVWPEDGADGEALIRSADIAMYHAKGRGGNSYEFFNASMNRAASDRMALEVGLRHALERDQLLLHYQPIRDSRTGRISAVEALVRWVDDDGQMIRPDQFIPIAEETGLIVPIGEWILRTACRQAVAWREAGLESIRLSVNVSVEQLRDLGIVNTVESVLFETGLSVQDLELEITESSILDESPNIVAALGGLTDLGIDFALDDFGTGYSSLSALQRFPIERLKIDRSFVSGIGENESDEALSSAVVALAKRLGLLVVAEGVETEQQARVLTSLGCQELQGYLFSKPLPAEELAAFLRADEQKRERRDGWDVAGPEGAE